MAITKNISAEQYIIQFIHNVMNSKGMKKRMRKKQNHLALNEYKNELISASREILKKLNPNLRVGRNPFILAGATIYIADKLIAREYKQKPILTQTIISKTTKISEYSIRDYYVKLMKPLFIRKEI